MLENTIFGWKGITIFLLLSVWIRLVLLFEYKIFIFIPMLMTLNHFMTVPDCWSLREATLLKQVTIT